MANNKLETAYSAGQPIDSSHVNELTLALLNDFVGRNASGIPLEGMNLGTNMIPWGTLFTKSIVLNGQVLDQNGFNVPSTRIISGRSNPNSAKSNFIKPSGSGLSFQILGGSTPLKFVLDNNEVTVDNDITVNVQGVTTDNVATVYEGGKSPTLGEKGNYTLNVLFPESGEFSNIFERKEFFAIKFPTNEIYFGQAIGLPITDGIPAEPNIRGCSNGYRGYFYDADLNPIVRTELGSFFDSCLLLKLGWVFMDLNGATVDVSYSTPVYSSSAPSDAITGQYYYNNATKKWNRYNGTEWFELNRILLGVVASDNTKCIAARSFDFHKSFEELNTTTIGKVYNRVEESVLYNDIGLKSAINRVSVNGNNLILDYKTIKWEYPLNKDSYPVLRPTSNTFWIYITENGLPMISSIEPYDRVDLKGFYHPYEMWRCIGEAYITTEEEKENAIGATSFKYNTEIKSEVATFQEIFSGATNYGNSVLGNNKRKITPIFPNPIESGAVLAFDEVNYRVHIPKGRYYASAYSSAKNTGYATTRILPKTNRVGAPALSTLSGPLKLTDSVDNAYVYVDGAIEILDNDYYLELVTYVSAVATNGLGTAIPIGVGQPNIASKLFLRREN